MRLIPHSFNGFFFQQNNRVSSTWDVPFDWSVAGISTNSLPRSQAFPQYTTKNYSGSIKVISVVLNDVDADRDSLVISMDVLGAEQHRLISTDRFGNEWYVDAVCIGLNEESTSDNTASFGLSFDVADPIWKKVIPSTKVIAVNSTGAGAITPLGNQPALPIITIAPTTSGSTRFLYKKFIQIYSKTVFAMRNYALDITNGGLNTAALVGAGKMLANGDDLRVYVDGVEVKRWFGGGGINSPTTTIWISWTQPKKTELTLGANIIITGAVTTIIIEDTVANNTALATIPTTGAVLIGSEMFTYTGVNVAGRQITGCTRAAYGSSNGAHSLGDTIRMITHEVWLYYGDPAIAPYVDTDWYKPAFDLVNSNNLLHIYDNFFGQMDKVMSSMWLRFSQYGSIGDLYGTDIEPATTYVYGDAWGGMSGIWIGITNLFVLGNQMSPGDNSRNYKWAIVNPVGITHITARGRKFWSPGALWWNMPMGAPLSYAYHPRFIGTALDTMGYQQGAGITYIWQELPPAFYNTWGDLTSHENQALPFTMHNIGFLFFSPNVPWQIATGTSFMHYDYISLTLDANNLPNITMSAEVSSLNIDMVVTNDATGYSIEIDISLPAGQSLIIDTAEKTIILTDSTNRINAMSNFPVRDDWFPLLPSEVNNISIVDDGESTVTFSWNDRSL